MRFWINSTSGVANRKGSLFLLAFRFDDANFGGSPVTICGQACGGQYVHKLSNATEEQELTSGVLIIGRLVGLKILFESFWYDFFKSNVQFFFAWFGQLIIFCSLTASYKSYESVYRFVVCCCFYWQLFWWCDRNQVFFRFGSTQSALIWRRFAVQIDGEIWIYLYLYVPLEDFIQWDQWAVIHPISRQSVIRTRGNMMYGPCHGIAMASALVGLCHSTKPSVPPQGGGDWSIGCVTHVIYSIELGPMKLAAHVYHHGRTVGQYLISSRRGGIVLFHWCCVVLCYVCLCYMSSLIYFPYTSIGVGM